MSRSTGNRLVELRRSNAATPHVKYAKDRRNTERLALEAEMRDSGTDLFWWLADDERVEDFDVEDEYPRQEPVIYSKY